MNRVCLIMVAFTVVVHGRETMISKLGQLHFFDGMVNLNFNIELSTFYENAELYNNITNRIIMECKKLPNATCDSEIKNIEVHQSRSKQMVEYMAQDHNMRKRRWTFVFAALRVFAARFLAVSAVSVASSAITSYAMTKSARAEQDYNSAMLKEAFERNLNHSRESLENDMKNQHEEQLLNLQREYYDKLKNDALDLFSNQNQLYTIFSDIFDGNAHKRFFEIISVTEFTKEIDSFRASLPEGVMFPRVGPTILLDLSMISFTKNDSFINLVVRVPVIYQKSHELLELTPVPQFVDNKIVIFKLDSVLYTVLDNVIKIFPYENLDYCLRRDNLIICNSMLLGEFNPPTGCLNRILNGKNDEPCEYKVLQTKNYYMEISNTLLYCFIVTPVKLNIICNDQNLIYKLNETNLISYGKTCEIYKVSNSSELNRLAKNITIDFSYAAPNFTVYDTLLQNWTYDYTIINKRSITTLDSQAELIGFWEENKDYKKTGSWFYDFMDDINNSVGSFIDFFRNWFDTFIIKYFVMPVVSLLCVYLLCIRVKRRSFPIVTECK